MSRRPSASRSQITETVFVHVWKVRPGPNWANKQQFSHLFRLKSAHANNWSGRKGNKEWGVHGGLLTCSVLLSITSSLYTCLSFTSLDSCPVFVCTSCSCLYSYVCYQPDLTHSAKAQHYWLWWVLDNLTAVFRESADEVPSKSVSCSQTMVAGLVLMHCLCTHFE